MDQLSYATLSPTTEIDIDDLYAFHAALDGHRRARRAKRQALVGRFTRPMPQITAATLAS